jgi:hypothetical protein
VRATDSRNKVELVLHVHTRAGLRTLTLLPREGQWMLTVDFEARQEYCSRFANIVELVDYYKVGFLAASKEKLFDLVQIHRLPGSDQRLKHAIRRPKHLIRNGSVKFDEKTDFLGSGNFCRVYRGQYEYNRHKAVITVAVKVSGRYR